MLSWVRVGQVRVGQVKVGQVRVGQVRVDQVKVGQVRVVQVRVGQVRVEQVRLVRLGLFSFGLAVVELVRLWLARLRVGQVWIVRSDEWKTNITCPISNTMQYGLGSEGSYELWQHIDVIYGNMSEYRTVQVYQRNLGTVALRFQGTFQPSSLDFRYG
jgi:hypothetical protein